jgi:hypothetical protein
MNLNIGSAKGSPPKAHFVFLIKNDNSHFAAFLYVRKILIYRTLPRLVACWPSPFYRDPITAGRGGI